MVILVTVMMSSDGVKLGARTREVGWLEVAGGVGNSVAAKILAGIWLGGESNWGGCKGQL